MIVLVMVWSVMYVVNISVFIVLSLIMTVVKVTMWYHHGYVFVKSVARRVHDVDSRRVFVSRI